MKNYQNTISKIVFNSDCLAKLHYVEYTSFTNVRCKKKLKLLLLIEMQTCDGQFWIYTSVFGTEFL